MQSQAYPCLYLTVVSMLKCLCFAQSLVQRKLRKSLSEWECSCEMLETLIKSRLHKSFKKHIAACMVCFHILCLISRTASACLLIDLGCITIWDQGEIMTLRLLNKRQWKPAVEKCVKEISGSPNIFLIFLSFQG